MANFSTKLASTVSAAAIVASATGASLVSAASEFLPYAEALVNKKVINAQSTEAGYRLNDQITRAELAKVAANLGGYTAVECTGKVFTDVNSSLGDLCTAIETLAAAKVVSTTNTTFRPSANVTRAEMTKMILGALGKTPSTTKGIFADVTSTLGDLEGFINAAAEGGIVNKGTNFYPNNTGSRGEVFKIAARAAGLEISSTTPTTPSTTAGKVSVAVVGQPVAQEVPRNVVAHEVATVKVTANDGDVNLSSVLINRSGLGTSNGLEVALVHNGVVVSENVSVNNTTQNANIALTNPMVIKNGTSAEFTVIATLNPETKADENNRHTFSLVGVNGENLATPLTLGLFATTTYEVAAITVNDVVGYKGVKAGQHANILDVTLTSPSNRETTVTGFTLTKTTGSTLTEAISNVKVLVDGKDTGAKATVTADKIIVTGLNQDLTFSQSVKFTLSADVIYVGKGSNTIIGNYGAFDFTVNKSVDVSGREKGTKFNLRVNNNNKVGKLEIQGITVKITPETTTTKAISLGDEGTFLDATLTSTVPFTLRAFDFIPTLIMSSGVTAPQLDQVFEYLTLNVDGQDYPIVKSAYNAGNSGVNYNNLTTNTSIRFIQSGNSNTYTNESLKYVKDGQSNEAKNHEVAANTPLRVTLKGKLLEANTSRDVNGALVINNTNAPVNSLQSFKPVFRTLVIQPKNTATNVEFIQDLNGDRYKVNDFSDVFKAVSVNTLNNGEDKVFAKYTFDVTGSRKVLLKHATVETVAGPDNVVDFTQLVQDVGNSNITQNLGQYYRIRVTNSATTEAGKEYTGTVTTSNNNQTLGFDFTQGAVELLPGKNTIELIVDAKAAVANKYLQVKTTLDNIAYENATSTLTVAAVNSHKILVNKFSSPSIVTGVEKALKSIDLLTKDFTFSIKNNESADLTVTKVTGYIYTKDDVTINTTTPICISTKSQNNECTDTTNADTVTGTITQLSTKAYKVDFDLTTAANVKTIFENIKKNETSSSVNLLLSAGLRNTLMADENVTITLATADSTAGNDEKLASPFTVVFTR